MGVLAEGLKKRDEPVKCKFATLVEKYADDEDRAMIDDPRVGHKTIAVEVSRAWERVSDYSVKAHRFRECTCFRTEPK